MIPALTRPPVAHPAEQFQQVTAIRPRRAAGTEPPVRQIIREPAYQPRARHSAAAGNDTIEHGEAPAGEGLQEDTSYYRGFASLHDQERLTDTRSRQNITSRQPGTASIGP
jgi:hypothetical protein